MASQKKQGEGLQGNGGGGHAASSTCFCLERLETKGSSWCAILPVLALNHWVLKSSLQLIGVYASVHSTDRAVTQDTAKV